MSLIFCYRRWCATFPACDGNYSTFSLTLVNGIYTVQDLFDQVSVFSKHNGHGIAAFYFSMQGDHVSLIISEAGMQVDFSGSDTIGSFLGFAGSVYPPSGPTNYTEYRVLAEHARGNLNVEAFKPVETGTSLVGQDSDDFKLGERHTLVRTAGRDGRTRLWSFGSNKFGQLGNVWHVNSELPNVAPRLIYEFDELYGGQRAVNFEAGGRHCMVQTEDGNLWVFGSNWYGQLGILVNSGVKTANWKPMLWSSTPIISWQAVSNASEANAGNLTNAAGNEAVEQSCSAQNCSCSDTGVPSTISPWAVSCGCRCQPKTRALIDASHVIISDFALGGDHSMVLLVDGETGASAAFAFGSNEFGQLAHDGALNGTSPTAGMCLWQDKIEFCQHVWQQTFFEPDAADLLVPLANHMPLPLLISNPHGSRSELELNREIVAIRLGGHHSLVLTRDGRLWCAGSNIYGQCGSDIEIWNDYEGQRYPVFENRNFILKLVGSKYMYTSETYRDTNEAVLVSPSLTCCSPRNPFDADFSIPLPGCSCPSGHWLFKGKCISCPFEGARVSTFIAANTHSIVQTTGDLWYSFGLNADGQLLRPTENLGLANANAEIEVVARTIFGDSNQPFIDLESGSTADHSLAQTYRDFCAPGNHSIDRRSPCQRCDAGGHSPTKGTLTDSFLSFDQSVKHPHSVRYNLRWLPPVILNCPPCGAGNFSETSSSHCYMCASGKYSFDGASTCHKCTFGTFTDRLATQNCSLCVPGKTSLEGQTVCFDCGIGEEAPVNGSEKCVKCQPGSYTGHTGTPVCYPCDVYSYQNDTGSSACRPCPADRPTTARYGATDLSMCQTLCPAGMSGDTLGESTASMRNCRPCPPGYYGYNDDIPDGLGATSCRQCVPGKYSPSSVNESRTGAPLCTLCAGGKFAGGYATSACSDCAAATFSPPGSTVCYQCTPGTFSLGAQELCTPCGPGTYNPYNMSSQCFTCSAGTFSGPGASVCTNCSAGSFSLARSSNCTLCRPGRAQPEDGQTSCVLCVPGKFATGGASSCTDCRPGNFSWGPYPLNTTSPEGRGASVCSICPVGSFSALNGTANCSLCAAGSFGPEMMMSACRLCVGGYFTPVPGLSICDFCTPGFFSQSNFSACRECSVGSFSALNASANCTLCAAGFFANTTGMSSCLGCAAGTFGNTTGLSACLDCIPGSVSQRKAVICDLCIPGTVAPRARMTTCDLCEVGRYVDRFGATACTSCPAGLSTQGQNAGIDGRPLAVPGYFNSLDACVPYCAPGTFSMWGVRPLGAGASCTLCPPGYFNSENGSTLCFPCAGGSYSRAGAALCSSCEAGKFSPAAQSVCRMCSIGTFASRTGMSACVKCGLDTFSDNRGSTSCTVCPSTVSEIVYSTLYIRDCRAACVNESIASQGGCVACEGAPLYEITLAEGTYSLASMEDAINRQVCVCVIVCACKCVCVCARACMCVGV